MLRRNICVIAFFSFVSIWSVVADSHCETERGEDSGAALHDRSFGKLR